MARRGSGKYLGREAMGLLFIVFKVCCTARGVCLDR